MKARNNGERRGVAGRVLALAMATGMLGGCAATNGSAPQAGADTMTMAEQRLDDAGGPAKAAIPAGLASPQAAPGPVSPGALTDAGANTPLGKEWIFTSVDGFTGTLPPPPTDASFVMSRGNGRLVGTTSCNPMSAAFAIDMVSASLKFTTITNGQAMCGEPNADVEDAVLDVLTRTDSFVLDGKNLTLKAKGYPIAQLVTQP